jgi:hypothetical protein
MPAYTGIQGGQSRTGGPGPPLSRGDVRVSLDPRLKGVFCSVSGQRGSLCREESADLVIPAQAGIPSPEVQHLPWAPGCAGVTSG